MTQDADKVELVRQLLEDAKRYHIDLLEREMFKENVFFYRHNVPPASRAQQIRRRIVNAGWRVRSYVSTLWLALCGHDLIESEWYD